MAIPLRVAAVVVPLVHLRESDRPKLRPAAQYNKDDVECCCWQCQGSGRDPKRRRWPRYYAGIAPGRDRDLLMSYECHVEGQSVDPALQTVSWRRWPRLRSFSATPPPQAPIAVEDAAASTSDFPDLPKALAELRNDPVRDQAVWLAKEAHVAELDG